MLNFVGQQMRVNLRRLPCAAVQIFRASVIPERNSSTNTTPKKLPVESALVGWDKKLQEAGVGDIDFNLKCIVAHVLKIKFSSLRNYEAIDFTPDQLAEFERLCEARCARMPLQYILGEWDFLNITLKTAPTVFIPRPESEEFVLKIIDEIRDAPIVNMLEVGCGSGAMTLAILHELPQVRATAIERSKLATALAFENAQKLKLSDRFKVFNHTVSDGAYVPNELAERKYDLIISNPPYVKTEEFQHLQPEVVAYENLNALDGGSDGLCIAKLVFDLACLHLRPGGKLWMELSSEHPPLVKTIMNLKYEGRLRYISGHKDQYQRERFVEIEKV